MNTVPKRNPIPAMRDQTRDDSMRPPEQEAKVDMAALEAKVAQNIAPMSGDTPAKETPPTRKLEMPGSDKVDPTPDESGSVEEESRTEEPKADEQKTDDGPPAIPENYIAAAKHQGITDEDVAKMYETNPQGAVDFLKNVYESTNKLSRSFANLGRKQQEIQAQANKAPETPAVSAVDYSAIEEEYGKDSPIVERMKQQDTQIAELTARKAAEPVQQNVDPVIMTTLDNFFGSDAMKPFQSFYGVTDKGNWNTLNNGEYAERAAVIGMAEKMVLGAQAQGEQMPLDQALGLAHLAVSEGMREQAVRAEIKGKMKAKAKGVTLAPSSSGTGTPSGRNADGTKTQAQLEADTKARLARLTAGQKVRG